MRFQKKGPVLLLVDGGGKPITLEVTGVLTRQAAPNPSTRWYCAVQADDAAMSRLLEVDAVVKALPQPPTGSPLTGRSLLVKLPFANGRHGCSFVQDGAPGTSRLVTHPDDTPLTFQLEFGGVWVQHDKSGYTWKAKCVSR